MANDVPADTHLVDMGPDLQLHANVQTELARGDIRGDQAVGLGSHVVYKDPGPGHPDHWKSPARCNEDGHASCCAMSRAVAPHMDAEWVGVVPHADPQTGEVITHCFIVRAGLPGQPTIQVGTDGRALSRIPIERIHDEAIVRGMNGGVPLPESAYQGATLSPYWPAGTEDLSHVHMPADARLAEGQNYQGDLRVHVPKTPEGVAVAEAAHLAARAVRPPVQHRPRPLEELYAVGRDADAVLAHVPGWRTSERLLGEFGRGLEHVAAGRLPVALPGEAPPTPAHQAAAQKLIQAGQLIGEAKLDPVRVAHAAAQVAATHPATPAGDEVRAIVSELHGMLPGVVPHEIVRQAAPAAAPTVSPAPAAAPLPAPPAASRDYAAVEEDDELPLGSRGDGFSRVDGDRDRDVTGAVALYEALASRHVGHPWDGRRPADPRMGLVRAPSAGRMSMPAPPPLRTAGPPPKMPTVPMSIGGAPSAPRMPTVPMTFSGGGPKGPTPTVPMTFDGGSPASPSAPAAPAAPPGPPGLGPPPSAPPPSAPLPTAPPPSAYAPPAGLAPHPGAPGPASPSAPSAPGTPSAPSGPATPLSPLAPSAGLAPRPGALTPGPGAPGAPLAAGSPGRAPLGPWRGPSRPWRDRWGRGWWVDGGVWYRDGIVVDAAEVPVEVVTAWTAEVPVEEVDEVATEEPVGTVTDDYLVVDQVVGGVPRRVRHPHRRPEELVVDEVAPVVAAPIVVTERARAPWWRPEWLFGPYRRERVTRMVGYDPRMGAAPPAGWIPVGRDWQIAEPGLRIAVDAYKTSPTARAELERGGKVEGHTLAEVLAVLGVRRRVPQAQAIVASAPAPAPAPAVEVVGAAPQVAAPSPPAPRYGVEVVDEVLPGRRPAAAVGPTGYEVERPDGVERLVGGGGYGGYAPGERFGERLVGGGGYAPGERLGVERGGAGAAYQNALRSLEAAGYSGECAKVKAEAAAGRAVGGGAAYQNALRSLEAAGYSGECAKVKAEAAAGRAAMGPSPAQLAEDAVLARRGGGYSAGPGDLGAHGREQAAYEASGGRGRSPFVDYGARPSAETAPAARPAVRPGTTLGGPTGARPAVRPGTVPGRMAGLPAAGPGGPCGLDRDAMWVGTTPDYPLGFEDYVEDHAAPNAVPPRGPIS